MTMGNAMSRLAMILRKKRAVSPNQIHVPERSISHERCEKRQRLLEKTDNISTILYFLETPQSSKYISSMEVVSVEECGDVSNVQLSSELGESFQPIRTDALDSINYQTVENDVTDESFDPEQNTKTTVSSNDTKFVQKERVFSKEALSFTERLVRDSKNLPHGTLKSELQGISAANILNIENTLSLSYSSDKAGDNGLSQDRIDGQEKKLDSLSWISRDGYSTEGTAGSVEESFGDKDDDIINRLLVDNIDDVGIDCKSFETCKTEVPNSRKSALTQLSLETLNCNELDRRECVRSYIEAWSPLNFSTAGITTYSSSLPGACVDVASSRGEPPKSYDRPRSIFDDSNENTSSQPRELYELDSHEFCLFHQRSPEPVSRPLSDSWDLLKNDRAPWINIGYTGSEEVIQGREGLSGDHVWQDQNNRLTLCSLSTINEENDDVDRI